MRTVICNILVIITILQVLEALRLFNFNEEEKECIKQSDDNEKQVMFKFLKYETPEDDTQFNNFMECSWSKLEYLTKNGDVNYEKLKNSYEIERKVGEDHPKVLVQLDKFRPDAVSKCEIDHASLKADTASITAVRVQNCIVKNYLEITYPFRA